MHYFITSHSDEETRRKYDELMQSFDKPVIVSGKRAPSWWRGSDAAAASTLDAARQLGFAVPTGVM